MRTARTRSNATLKQLRSNSGLRRRRRMADTPCAPRVTVDGRANAGVLQQRLSRSGRASAA